MLVSNVLMPISVEMPPPSVERWIGAEYPFLNVVEYSALHFHRVMSYLPDYVSAPWCAKVGSKMPRRAVDLQETS